MRQSSARERGHGLLDDRLLTGPLHVYGRPLTVKRGGLSRMRILILPPRATLTFDEV